MPKPLLEISDLGLDLPRESGMLTVLDQVSFTLDSGVSLAVTGPSGSGKTSLLMLIAGLVQASRGRIYFDGHDLCAMNEDQLAGLRAGHLAIVFQSFHLLPNLSALENVLLALELTLMRDKATHSKVLRSKAQEMLEAVGLGERLNHYPAQLSGGEQQRVALARAFVCQPRLLLADEPTGNLDGPTGDKVMKIMFDLCRHYASSLILITHDPELAGRCDRHSAIQNGTMVIN